LYFLEGGREVGKSHDHDCDVIVIEELRFQNVSCPHESEKLAFSNSSVLKSVIEKLSFRGGSVGMVTVENNATFSNTSGVV